MEERKVSFLEERCSLRWNRLPIVTITTIFLQVAIFYNVQGGEENETLFSFAYRRREGWDEWYRCYTYAFFHTTPFHLWTNVATFLVGGILFEATESVWRALFLMLTSIPASSIGHGLFRDSYVVGGSGFVYAFLFYQASLLLKNWRQMGLVEETRHVKGNCHFIGKTLLSAPVRAFIILTMIVTEIVSSQIEDGVSYEGHAFGSMCGIGVGAILGSDVVCEKLDMLVSLCGVALYTFLFSSGFWSSQTAPSLFLLLLYFPLLLYFYLFSLSWLGEWKVEATLFPKMGFSISRRGLGLGDSFSSSFLGDWFSSKERGRRVVAL